MELVLAVVLAAATGLLVSCAGRHGAIFGAVAQLVSGYRPDGWPTGVQEEDREGRWGTGARIDPRATLPPVPGPTLSRVRPTVHPR